MVTLNPAAVAAHADDLARACDNCQGAHDVTECPAHNPKHDSPADLSTDPWFLVRLGKVCRDAYKLSLSIQAPDAQEAERRAVALMTSGNCDLEWQHDCPLDDEDDSVHAYDCGPLDENETPTQYDREVSENARLAAENSQPAAPISAPTNSIDAARPVATLAIPDDAWRPTGGYSGVKDVHGRLLATVEIAGTLMHLEAYAVEVAPDETNGGTFVQLLDNEADSALGVLMVESWPPTTTMIRGREYALIATPYAE